MRNTHPQTTRRFIPAHKENKHEAGRTKKLAQAQETKEAPCYEEVHGGEEIKGGGSSMLKNSDCRLLKRLRGEAREKSTSGGVIVRYVGARQLSATKHMRFSQRLYLTTFIASLSLIARARIGEIQGPGAV
jgi:hypothetical protein